MIDETLAKIQQQLERSSHLPADKLAELQDLVTQLKTEIATISKSDPEQAHSIAGFTEVSAREATRSQPHPDSVKSALEGLGSTVQGFEVAHPKLTAVVNRLAEALSNLGI